MLRLRIWALPQLRWRLRTGGGLDTETNESGAARSLLRSSGCQPGAGGPTWQSNGDRHGRAWCGAAAPARRSACRGTLPK